MWSPMRKSITLSKASGASGIYGLCNFTDRPTLLHDVFAQWARRQKSSQHKNDQNMNKHQQREPGQT